MTRFTKTANGKYNIQGKVYDLLSGTRAQVWHETAYKTSGGLTKKTFFKTKTEESYPKQNMLHLKGDAIIEIWIWNQKGKFGFVKVTGKSKKNNKKMKGGNGVNYALSPSHISGISKTSGVELQFMVETQPHKFSIISNH